MHPDVIARLKARFQFAATYPDALSLEKRILKGAVETKALRLISDTLRDAYTTPNSRVIICMPPQEGKTMLVRSSVVHQLALHPETRVILASYGISLARKHGRWIRDRIRDHASLLGIQPKRGHASVEEWTLEGHDGGVLSVGVGSGASGNPADLIVIDDPVKDRKEADSPTYRDDTWDWWTDVISARMGATTSVVVVMTRWHEDDLAGRLIAQGGWDYLNIPAQCEDPDTDPLGRELGEFMDSARGRTQAQWEQRKATFGARAWNALCQGRPAPAEGGIVKRDWWRTYDIAPWIEREDGSRWAAGMDQMLISADLTFKGGDGSDFVALGVWGRRGSNAFLLDQVRGHYDFPETLRRFTGLCARWPQATLKLVEDKANGPAMIASLSREIPGIVPESPQGSKQARATAVAPLIEAGNVHLPDPRIAPWVDDFIEEWAAFPNGAHDDQVDQTTQALNRLLLQPLLLANRDEVGELFDFQPIINY